MVKSNESKLKTLDEQAPNSSLQGLDLKKIIPDSPDSSPYANKLQMNVNEAGSRNEKV